MADFKDRLAAAAGLAGVALLGGFGVTAASAPRALSRLAATAPVPVIVELFTSEGCSSCPPADAVLIDLLKTQPVSGAMVIGLSEHVDYWNQLGWKDPFSDHLFSDRQHAYAAATRSADVYTPQMIVDGGAGFVGSDRQAAIAAIGRAAATPKAPVSLAWTESAAASPPRPAPRTIGISLAGGAPAAGATMFLAVVEDGLSSSVRAGENSGHVLPHGAVTRRLVDIGRADRTGAFTRTDQRVDLDPAWHTAALHVIVFAQASGMKHVVAAGTVAVMGSHLAFEHHDNQR